MDRETIQFGLTSLITLFVVVDPIGLVPIFTTMTKPLPGGLRKGVVRRAVFVAFLVALGFLLIGDKLLGYLGVSLYAFSISGGILLFITALPMLFGGRGGLQSPEQAEHATEGEDIAIFPLAIPLLSGPGTIATALLLASRATGSPSRLIVLILVAALVYLISLFVLQAGQWVLSRMGEGKVHILTRVMGIILAALAAQYVLNGITGYYDSFAGRHPTVESQKSQAGPAETGP
jgi:multiple antibiotic resistance protein